MNKEKAWGMLQTYCSLQNWYLNTMQTKEEFTEAEAKQFKALFDALKELGEDL